MNINNLARTLKINSIADHTFIWCTKVPKIDFNCDKNIQNLGLKRIVVCTRQDLLLKLVFKSNTRILYYNFDRSHFNL